MILVIFISVKLPYNAVKKIPEEELMIEKLAPIHFVQHRRIRIQEQLESFLAKKFAAEPLLASLIQKYGAPSSDVNLAEQIDHSNIHGWLESHLISNEKRMADLLSGILGTYSIVELQLAYKAYGHEIGASLSKETSVSTSQELYQLLQTVLLDGMPCDKVNRLVESSDHHLVFSSTKDMHAPYYSEAGLGITLYHELREYFIAGFLESLDAGTYSYICNDGSIFHKVLL